MRSYQTITNAWLKGLVAGCCLVTLLACGSTEMSNSNGGELEGAPPSAEADSFDLDLALKLGRLCLQSYQMLDDFQNGRTFTLPAPFTLVKIFLTNEHYVGELLTFGTEVPIAFVATEGENIYVVFRGTDTISEWIDDAEFAQVTYSFLADSGKTEEGFTKVYATLDQGILETVQGLISNGSFSNLFVTGHSLGAAVAVLAAPQLQAQTSLKPVMYNFAGPRVGDPTFSISGYGSRINTSWRVANTNDLVPKLPNTIVVVFQNGMYRTFFYEHVSQVQSITFGNPVTGPTDIKDIEDNHIMCNYYNELCKMTSDVESCMAMADGADGCNASMN